MAFSMGLDLLLVFSSGRFRSIRFSSRNKKSSLYYKYPLSYYWISRRFSYQVHRKTIIFLFLAMREDAFSVLLILG